MRSKIITGFRKLMGSGIEGVTPFVIYGRTIVSSKIDKRQIERTLKRCVDLKKTDFNLGEAINHFYRISHLESEKRIKTKI